MYKLYLADCAEHTKICLRERFYRHIFNTHFNLSFHTPKKDHCVTCTAYEIANAETRVTLQENYDRHIAFKNRARQEKNSDKIESVKL
ncbi:hypothetical protein NQ314_017040 [Rhamnusium bicolor]|uniref:Uncharacterized protein n=1 Tax=Rhamnusium bicolor TaxID=1586634 RepID=A0AAV8WX38_9CUCU|nr:hypothetical protein NQ314_017040 [Rhamnusium bicolor]